MKEGQPSFDETQQANLDKLNHRNPEWQAFAGREHRAQAPVEILTAESFAPDEVAQLQERGATFPLEVRGAPEKTVHLYKETEVRNGRGEVIGYDTGIDYGLIQQ